MTFFINKNDEKQKFVMFFKLLSALLQSKRLPFPLLFYAATCCRIIFCVEDDGKMTMMSTGWRRKITFYDGITFAEIPFHYA